MSGKQTGTMRNGGHVCLRRKTHRRLAIFGLKEASISKKHLVSFKSKLYEKPFHTVVILMIFDIYRQNVLSFFVW